MVEWKGQWLASQSRLSSAPKHHPSPADFNIYIFYCAAILCYLVRVGWSSALKPAFPTCQILTLVKSILSDEVETLKHRT